MASQDPHDQHKPQTGDIIISQMRIGYWLFRTVPSGTDMARQVIGYADEGSEARRLAEELASNGTGRVWIDSGAGPLLLMVGTLPPDPSGH